MKASLCQHPALTLGGVLLWHIPLPGKYKEGPHGYFEVCLYLTDTNRSLVRSAVRCSDSWYTRTRASHRLQSLEKFFHGERHAIPEHPLIRVHITYVWCTLCSWLSTHNVNCSESWISKNLSAKRSWNVQRKATWSNGPAIELGKCMFKHESDKTNLQFW